MNFCLGEKNHIGGKDTCNGAAGTDDGNDRGRIHQGLDYAGRKAGSEIENGKFIPKWRHEFEMKNGSIDKVRELQEKVMKQEKTIRECFEEIDRISEEKDNMDRRFESTAMELDELQVTVNGHRYKVL